MWDNSYLQVLLSNSSRWHCSSTSLTHLVHVGSVSERLPCLLASLPNLISLHLSLLSWLNVSDGYFDPPKATCKLRELVLQSVYLFDQKYVEHILGSSRDSLAKVSFADCDSAFEDVLDYIAGATQLTLAIGKDRHAAESMNLDRLIQLMSRFTALDRVSCQLRRAMQGPYTHSIISTGAGLHVRPRPVVWRKPMAR